ncbi:MAG: hypothetical protein IIA58_02885 [Candidatus Marinimicrobia bacterium]|nr:hypothetical protein [Candidatus Neomarinimicrobiota bacterium]
MSIGLRRHVLMVLLMLSFPTLSFAQGKLLHAPPAGVVIGNEVEIITSVDNPTIRVLEINLLYRQRGFESYNEISMIESSGLWSVTIPAIEVTDAGVEYLIIADLEGGGQIAFPEANPYEQPMFLATLIEKTAEIEEVAGAQGAVEGANMIVLSPEPNSRTRANEVLIAVSLFYMENLDISSVSIFLNGIDVTDKSILSDELITYAPDNLEPGIKTVIIESADISGEPLKPLQWDFTVAREGERVASKFKINGRGFVDTRSDKIQGKTDDILTSRVSVRGSYDFVNFNGSGYITSKEDKLLQPKNRFMFGMKTNWLEVKFGDINPNLTPLTIYGKRIRGAESKLELGFFNLHTVFGQLEREIPAEISAITESFIDADSSESYTSGEIFTDTNKSGSWEAVGDVIRSGTYQRNLFAIRPSFGPNRRVQWGFTFARARNLDRIETNLPLGGIANSRRRTRFDYVFETATGEDSVFVDLGKTPQDNMIIGSDLFIGFNNNRIIFNGEVAFSLLARDITDGPFTKLGLDTLLDENQGFGYRDDEPFDDYGLDGLPNTGDTGEGDGEYQVGEPFIDANKDGIRTRKDKPDDKIGSTKILIDPANLKRFFILNQSVIPLDPRGLNSLSYNAGFKFSFFKQFIRANYRYVGAEYNSLANPFIRKDFKGFKVSDRIRLMNNKLIVNLRFERLENNLADNKETTTVTTSFDGGLSIYPGRDMPRISLNVRNYVRDNGLDEITRDTLITETDTTITTQINERDLREQNSTVTSTFSIGYDLNAFGYKHSINLNVANSERTDDFRETRDSSYVISENSSTSLSIVVNTRYDIPFKSQLQFLTNKNQSAGAAEFTYTVFGFGGEYLMLDKKLTLLGNLKRSTTSGGVEFTENRLSFGARYKITDKQSILANADYSIRNQKAVGSKLAKTFNDYIIRARYSISF